MAGLRVAGFMLAIMLTFVKASSSQTASTLTPEQIKEAIEYGAAEKSAPLYVIRDQGTSLSNYRPSIAAYTTPFLRVAQAAYAAKKLYRIFSEAEVTEDMLAPELRVYGFSQAVGLNVANVQAIVVTPKGKHEPADAMRPISTSETPVQFRNLMGMTAEGTSLAAVFPLHVLSGDHELHVIYDSPVGTGNRRCEDCYGLFDMGSVRWVELGEGTLPGMHYVADERTQTYLPARCAEVSEIPRGQRRYYSDKRSVEAVGYKRSDKCPSTQ